MVPLVACQFPIGGLHGDEGQGHGGGGAKNG
jgi:hypothetical protein